MKRIPIQITDKESIYLKDKFMAGKPAGLVYIHERKVGSNKIFLVEKSNLIVYHGRSWLMQRAFNQDLTSNGLPGGTVIRDGWKDKYIAWFAVGTGGSVTGQPLVAASPQLVDQGLYSHGTIGGTHGIVHNGKHYHPFDSGYPRYAHDTDILQDDLDDLPSPTATDPVNGGTYPADSFLVGVVQVTLTADEGNLGGNHPDPNQDWQDINEAGLFLASTSDPANLLNSDMQLFAHVCFSTIRKTTDRELIFTWLIMF